jgi:glycosyltransferase involved in cell wall biosynthesis
MRQNLIEKQVSADKVYVIENWIDTREVSFIEREANPLFDQFGLDRTGFYVTYCGNLGYAQDLDTVLKSAKLLEEKTPLIQFIIVGNGVCEDAVRKKITAEKHRNVQMFPLQPEEASAFVYSLGDLGIVALKPQFLKHAMPSKTWAMMAASQTVLCTAEEHTRLYELIASSGAGVAVNPGSEEDLAAAITHLYGNRQRLREHGANGRAYAEKYLTREGATGKYYQKLKELAERREKHVSG